VTEIFTVVDQPRGGEEYDHIKEALLAAFGPTREAKNAALFALNGLGDCKPSFMMRHILSLAADDHGQPDGDTLVQAFFLAQLPSGIRSVLAAQTFNSRDDLATAADRVMESRQLNQIAAASPMVMVDAIKKDKTNKDPFICVAHKRYGLKAYTCKLGCMFEDAPLAAPPAGNAKATRR